MQGGGEGQGRVAEGGEVGGFEGERHLASSNLHSSKRGRGAGGGRSAGEGGAAGEGGGAAGAGGGAGACLSASTEAFLSSLSPSERDLYFGGARRMSADQWTFLDRELPDSLAKRLFAVSTMEERQILTGRAG